MRYIEFSLEDLKKNMKKNRKKMILIIAISIIIGICLGMYSGLFYKQPVYSLDDTIVDTVNLSSIEKDASYYYSAVCLIREKKLSLDSYVQYMGQVELGSESSVKIEDFKEKISQYEDEYKQIWNMWWSSSSVGYSTHNEMEEFIEQQIIVSDNNIETANQMIEEVQNNSFTRSFIATTEKNALDSILSAKNMKKLWENKMDAVRNSDEEVQADDNEKMDHLLADASDKLNNFVEEFNEIIKFIESNEQYDIIYNKYLLEQYVRSININEDLPVEKVMENSKNNAIIYARSIAGLDNNQERFFAIVTFFTLFGITIALLYGAFYTNRKREML